MIADCELNRSHVFGMQYIQLSDVNSFIIESIFQIHTLQSSKGIEMTLDTISVCLGSGIQRVKRTEKDRRKKLHFYSSHTHTHSGTLALFIEFQIKRSLSIVIQRWNHPHFNYLNALSTQWMWCAILMLKP